MSDLSLGKLFLGLLSVQGILMAIDEFYFHRKRGLRTWERLGHPLDTLSVISCFAWVIWIPFSQTGIYIYSALSGVSCLLVTKDERVHAAECTHTEMWLHSLLFMIHPLVLIVLGLVYQRQGNSELFTLFVNGQFAILSGFMIYQILYWNFFSPRSLGRG